MRTTEFARAVSEGNRFHIHADMIASSLFEAYLRGVTDDKLVSLAAVGIPAPQKQGGLSTWRQA